MQKFTTIQAKGKLTFHYKNDVEKNYFNAQQYCTKPKK
jgi:hypothetical protein